MKKAKGTEARESFGARNAAEAKRTAHGIVHLLIESYFDSGQPEERGCADEIPEADVRRLKVALEAICAKHEEKSR